MSLILGKDAVLQQARFSLLLTSTTNAIRVRLLGVLLISSLLVGCTGGGTGFVKVSAKNKNPFADSFDFIAIPDEDKPSPRTEQFLRRHDLIKMLDGDRNKLLQEIQLVLEKTPTPDGCQAYSELAYLGGRKLEAKDPKQALALYGAAVTHTYYYLFDPRFANKLNAYDPQFRLVCSLYNDSLRNCLKLTHKISKLKPDAKMEWHVGDHMWDVTTMVRGCSWQLDEFEDFQFVADYEAQGLVNQYRTFGLGVPLIVTRKTGKSTRPEERHFPPQLSFPLTAFVRILPDTEGSHAHQTPQAGTTCKRHRAQLEFYDPLRASDIVLENRLVPLETDLSTPLAYFLSNPVLAKTDYGTLGLLNPEATSKISGLYMLEPYSPHKIPVVLVHGLWSSPLTWLEMFNDLQGDVDLRQRYQFWFYLYPTGQPFWYSGTKFRKDLAEMRDRLDPHRQSYAMDQMVLVGHSMGGLVSRMQTVESGDDFWRLVSDKSISELKGKPDTLASFRELFYFQPNSSIKRVVTIGTPHLGSSKSNGATQWLGNKLISLPSMFKLGQDEIQRENPSLFRDKSLFSINTSIDSLSPQSPVLPVLYKSKQASWTRYHNIVGKVPQSGWYYFSAEGDGVVEYKNAVLPGVPELIVPADHVSLHRHPKSIARVQEILHEHAGTRRIIVNPWLHQDRDTSTARLPTIGVPAMSSLGVPVPTQQSSSTVTDIIPPVEYPTTVQPSQFQIPNEKSPQEPGQVPAATINPASLFMPDSANQSVPADQQFPPGIPMADTPGLMPVRR